MLNFCDRALFSSNMKNVFFAQGFLPDGGLRSPDGGRVVPGRVNHDGSVRPPNLTLEGLGQGPAVSGGCDWSGDLVAIDVIGRDRKSVV